MEGVFPVGRVNAFFFSLVEPTSIPNSLSFQAESDMKFSPAIKRMRSKKTDAPNAQLAKASALGHCLFANALRLSNSVRNPAACWETEYLTIAPAEK
jgi:hypothetical protein